MNRQMRESTKEHILAYAEGLEALLREVHDDPHNNVTIGWVNRAKVALDATKDDFDYLPLGVKELLHGAGYEPMPEGTRGGAPDVYSLPYWPGPHERLALFAEDLLRHKNHVLAASCEFAGAVGVAGSQVLVLFRRRSNA